MAKLSVLIVGNASEFTAAMAEAAAAAEGFGGRVRSVGESVASFGAKMTAGLTLPIGLAAAASVKFASDFQSSMELIHTQAGASQKEVENLSQAVLKLAGPTATAPDELAKGLFHLESQGLRGAKAIDALKIAAEGAKVGQADLEDVTNALGAAISAGLVPAGEFQKAMGAMNATVGAGDMHMQDLADAMGTGLAAKAKVAGVSLNDVSAALAVFGDNNIRGAEAGTALGSAIRLLSAPSKAAAKELASVGIGSLQLAQDLRSGGIPAALQDLEDHFKKAGLSASEVNQVLTRAFGGKQATGITILLDEMDRLKQKELEVRDGANKFGSAWQSTTQEAAFKFDQMKASLTAAGIAIGNVLMPYVTRAAQVVGELAAKFQALSPTTQKFAVAAAAAATALGPAVALIGGLISVVGLLLSPVVLVTAGIVALGVAMAAAVLWPDKLKDALERMGLSAQTSGRIVADLQIVFADLKAAFDTASTFIQAHWGQVVSVTTTAVADIKTAIQGLVSAAEAFWGTFGDTITTITKNTWTLVKSTVQNAMTEIRGVIDLVGGLIHGDWGRAWQGLKEIAGGAVDQVKAVLRADISNLAAIGESLGTAILHGVEDGLHGLLSFVETQFQNLGKTLISIAGEALGWAEGIGKAIVQGLINGIEALGGAAVAKAKSLVGKIKSAMEIWKSPPDAYGYWIGGLVAKGVGEGLKDGAPAAAQAAAAMVATIKAEIEQAATKIGLAQAQAVAAGFLQGTPTLAQQIKQGLQQAIQQAQQAVVASKQSFASAFTDLAQSALQAFDAVTNAWVSPAQKMLNSMQAQDQKNSLTQQLTDASTAVQVAQQQVQMAGAPSADVLQKIADAATKAQIAQDKYNQAVAKYGAASTQAQQALVALHAAQDAAAAAQSSLEQNQQAALQQLSDAQNAYYQAQRAMQEYNLSQQAAKQTAAYDKQRASQRDSLAKQLADLEKSLAKNPKAWDKMGKDVQAILKKFEVPLFESGQKFANQFADGITSKIAAVEAAAKAMAQAVAKYMPHSPAETGPLAFSSFESGSTWGGDFARGVAAGLYRGAGLAAFVPTVGTAQAVATTGGGFSGGRGGGSYSPTINVYGWVGSDQDIANRLLGVYQSGYARGG